MNEYCPKCNHWNIYSTHGTKNDTWGMKCVTCGYEIGGFKSHREAKKEWETSQKN